MANLQKLVNLLKKTGDKAIVLDDHGDPSYVIMTIAGYEDLILGKSGVADLTEDELLDKINRDIAIWKDTQELKELSVDQYNFARDIGGYTEDDYSSNFSDKMSEEEGLAIDEDRYYFEPVES